MEKAAAAMGDEVEIFALPISEGEKRVGDVDCILLGPQVRFQKLPDLPLMPRAQRHELLRSCPAHHRHLSTHRFS